ncbi:hypothetical protein BDV27DRAFT_132525, partial [Aspergillus caelatus]
MTREGSKSPFLFSSSSSDQVVMVAFRAGPVYLVLFGTSYSYLFFWMYYFKI